MHWRGDVATWSVVVAAVGALFAATICVAGRRIAAAIKAFDVPDGVEKRHAAPVPLVGGLAILVPLVVCVSLELAIGISPTVYPQLALLLCGIGAGVVGFADDQYEVGVLARIILLSLFAAAALAIDPSLILNQLHWGVLGATPVRPAVFEMLFIVACVGIVNAVNMADGADGIVGSMYFVWAVSLLIAGTATTRYPAAAIAGSSAVFLAFNLRGKLFLGDCGTYGITFAVGVLAAGACAADRISLETVTVWFALPVLDCLRLIFVRIRSQRSPFSRDRQHLHHLLENRAGRFGQFIYIGAVASSSILATIQPELSLGCLVFIVAGFVIATWPIPQASNAGSAIEATATIAETAQGETQAQPL